jgi:hypothetical protein
MSVNFNHLSSQGAQHAAMRGRATPPGKTNGKQGGSESKGNSSDKVEDADGNKNGAGEFASKVAVKGRGGDKGDGNGQGNPDGNGSHAQSTRKKGKAKGADGVDGIEAVKSKPIIRSTKATPQHVRRDANVTTQVAAARQFAGGAVELTPAHVKKFGGHLRELQMPPSAALSSRNTIKKPPFASRILEAMTNLPKSIFGGLFGSGSAAAQKKAPVIIPTTGHVEKTAPIKTHPGGEGPRLRLQP